MSASDGKPELELPGLGPGVVALVTGATGAIGGAVAAAFARLGVQVAVNGRSTSRAQQVAGDLPGSAIAVAGDVADPAEARRIVDLVLERWGRLDVLVHCAAISEGSVPLADLDPPLIETVVRANVSGSIVVAAAAAEPMRAAGRGRIVNVASIAGHRAIPGRVVYGTTKAALIHLTRQLAVELGPYGITVNCVSPGQTPTRITRAADPPGMPPTRKTDTAGEARLDRIPLGRRGELEDYVGPILFLASDLAAYVTGADLVIDGGAVAAL